MTHIVFPLYDGVTQLDFTGPHQVLQRLPGATLTVASLGGRDVRSDDGLSFGKLARLEDVAGCDVLCVPGGMRCVDAMQSAPFLDAVRRLGEPATYLTSVCSGSMILGAAGLLKGKRAACHWFWRDMLPIFGAIPDEGRIVRDGRLITGGGVTAGIDFALALVAEIAGDDVARSIQLRLEYAPHPPFDAGRFDTAPPALVETVRAEMAASRAARQALMESLAGKMP
jgi:transcriptional regulator GlxA family with amidase domain